MKSKVSTSKKCYWWYVSQRVKPREILIILRNIFIRYNESQKFSQPVIFSSNSIGWNNQFFCHPTALPTLEPHEFFQEVVYLCFYLYVSFQFSMTHKFKLSDCCNEQKPKRFSFPCFSLCPPHKIFRKPQKATYFKGKAYSLPVRLCGGKSNLIFKILI